MIILGRKAYAVDFLPFGPSFFKVYVDLKEGDCRKILQPDYQCTENCDGFFMEIGVRRLGQELAFSSNALMRKYEYIDPEILDGYGIRDFGDFERVFDASSRIYSQLRLVREPGDNIYMRSGKIIGRKTECGLNGDRKAFSEEAKITLASIIDNLPSLLLDVRKMTTREKIREASELALENPARWEIIKHRFLCDPEFMSGFQQYMMEIRKN